MKKFYYSILTIIPLAILSLLFVSCGSDDDDMTSRDSENNPKENNYSIVGVWENGEYFVSFDEDKFCSAYFDDEYIDCGTCTQTEKVITCKNTYYSKKTNYTITNINATNIELRIEYESLNGEKKSKLLSLTKNSDIEPAIKDHSLIGKSCTSLVWFGGNNNSTWSFETYNTGTHSMSSGAASKYPLRLFYIFINNKIYYQTFQTTQQMPTIGGWNPSIQVSTREVKFYSDGSIKI